MGGTMVRPGDTVESLLGRAEEALEATQAAHVNSILLV
jgi:predicted RNase H-like HicB family nuclease